MRGRKRPSPQVSREWLQSELLRYLGRYEASEARARALLWKRIKRAISFHGGSPESYEPLVNDLIEVALANKWLDDHRFATAWLESLRARGDSAIRIRQKLFQKLVPREVIDDILNNEDAGINQAAAARYAKRRGLGCHRTRETGKSNQHRRDIASMMRAGFDYQAALGAITPEYDE